MDKLQRARAKGDQIREIMVLQDKMFNSKKVRYLYARKVKEGKMKRIYPDQGTIEFWDTGHIVPISHVFAYTPRYLAKIWQAQQEVREKNVKITIQNKRTYQGPGEPIYRGKSPLGNPFYLKDVHDDQARNEVIHKYAVWLTEQIEKCNASVCKELARLYHLATMQEELILICWCAPKACHGDVIKGILLRRHDNPLPE